MPSVRIFFEFRFLVGTTKDTRRERVCTVVSKFGCGSDERRKISVMAFSFVMGLIWAGGLVDLMMQSSSLTWKA